MLPLEAELESAVDGSEDCEARQLSMLKEWTGNLDALRTTKIRSAKDGKGMTMVRTVSLSTNRLNPSCNKDSLVSSALARFSLLPESAPTALVSRAAEARAEAAAAAEWLELAGGGGGGKDAIYEDC